jgi:hypothetical protein
VSPATQEVTEVLQRVVLVPLVLCLMVAFAVEPTTSTQFDVAEGRGVVVVHGRGEQAPTHVITEHARPLLLFASVLVALLLALPRLQRTERDVGLARGRPAPRRRTPVLRAPPALV